MAILDPNRTSFIPFDAFLDYMTQETMVPETAEQIAESFRVLHQQDARLPRRR